MAGLWDALKQYIGDALPGGALNPETQPVATQANYLSGILDPASQVSQDAQAWHKRTQNGLMDQLAGRDTPEAEQAYQTMMQAAGIAPVGMIAWHGSPHKFDKFKLGEHIGTGDGTQMQGVGSYLAQEPKVAERYAKNGGNLYKTDIPDDVIPKMFDLDKPLMEQRHLADQLNAIHLADPSIKEAMFDAVKAGGNGQRLYDSILEKVAKDLKASGVTVGTHDGNLYDSANAIVSRKFQEAGIPGFKYLDRQSRADSNGTSNFVVFDPEMIRILERNGQPTGLQPWKPGEWK